MGAWLQHGEGWPDQLVHRGSESESGGGQHHRGRQEEISRLTRKNWEFWTSLIVWAGLPYQYKHRATLVWTSKFRPRNDIDKTVPESVHVNNWCVYISILFLLQGLIFVWCRHQTFGCLVVINSSPELTGRAGYNLSKGYEGDQVSDLATAIVLLCTPSP